MSGIPQTPDRSGIGNPVISNFEFSDRRPGAVHPIRVRFLLQTEGDVVLLRQEV